MHNIAKVQKIEGKKIKVVTLLSLSCISCQAKCNKHGKIFYVLNNKNFPITEGTLVKIDYPKGMKILQGLLAFLIPIILTLFAVIFSQNFLTRTNTPITDSIKFTIALSVLLISQITIFILSRTDFHLSKPEIIGLL